MKVGDTHNFGRYVQSAGKTRLLKPRPVYWEWLFFGLESPIQALFNDFKLKSGKSFATENFRLELTWTDHWEGEARAISERPNTTDGQGLAFSFGTLLAYTYYFGIYDLHSGNVFLMDDFLQVVDCEIVLGNPILPNESILIPFKDDGLETTGISKILGLVDFRSDEAKIEVFEGFLGMLRHLSNISEHLLREFGNLKLSEVPIRLIFRPTRKYVTYLAGKPSETMFEEEKTQLAIQDIPYFFHFLSDNEIYYYTSQDLSKRATIPRHPEWEEYQSRFKKIDLSNSLNSRRVQEALIPYGSLYLAKFLRDSFGKFDFQTSGLAVKGDDTIEVVIAEGRWRTAP